MVGMSLSELKEKLHIHAFLNSLELFVEIGVHCSLLHGVDRCAILHLANLLHFNESRQRWDPIFLRLDHDRACILTRSPHQGLLLLPFEVVQIQHEESLLFCIFYIDSRSSFLSSSFTHRLLE